MRSQIQAIAKPKSRRRLVMCFICGILGSSVLNTSVIAPTLAKPTQPANLQQSFSIPGFNSLDLPGIDNFLSAYQPTRDRNNPQRQIYTDWITLDGRRLFQVTASSREELAKRINEVQSNLEKISEAYFAQDSEAEPEVRSQRQTITDANSPTGVSQTLPTISINQQYLFTPTDLDAEVQGETSVQNLASKLVKSLKQDLIAAKQERKPPVLIRRGTIAAGIFVGIVVASWGIRRWRDRLDRVIPMPTTPTDPSESVTTQLTQQQQNNLREVRRRIFQLSQTGVWVGGTLVILGLFPYTRFIPVWILALLQIPIIRIPTVIGLVSIGVYVATRASYVAIDRFTHALANNALLGAQDYVRLQLRVMTISSVAKSVATFGIVALGVLLALSTLGVDLVPVLAGAGLLGVAISLASQSLIKDAINGFLIIVEDQYAVGDVINVGTFGGLVENLNLRITQLRDAEGRLITIPNSEIKIVANLSSRWSRADLSIPVAYNANLDQALFLIEEVGVEMDRDPQWRDQILERPEVLGVDNFGDRGLIIRVWIKTQPLKQWDVAREYRRRLKKAFDRADIAIPVPQQAVWVHTPHTLRSHLDTNDTSKVGK
ncbi:mechanosensitive ion channel family protein [Scytonema millei VB511283]|uniref:Mechanosensitive ion channel family protein n=1 Tax=Scytonema millei VB511283 TaxID=1245923 RepID=A0A9X5E7U1_9CYAN|nr:mechanosensitive ion channel family protein [Scytonema millei VB511283]